MRVVEPTKPHTEFVVYRGDDAVGTFGSIEEAAEFLGIAKSSAQWYASPSAEKYRKRTKIMRVVV